MRFQSNMHLQISLIRIYSMNYSINNCLYKQIQISFFSFNSFLCLLLLSFTPLLHLFPLLFHSFSILLFFFHSPQLSTGEFLSLAAMDTFLRSVQPEVNDLFVLSLVLINLLAWMDLFITQVTSCFTIGHSGEMCLYTNYKFTSVLKYKFEIIAIYLGISI